MNTPYSPNMLREERSPLKNRGKIVENLHEVDKEPSEANIL
jgi:hypothetical protein